MYIKLEFAYTVYACNNDVSTYTMIQLKSNLIPIALYSKII